MSYLSTGEAYEYNDLACWYQNSIVETQPPIWTDEHLEELLNDFYIIPKETPTADVVPKSEVERLQAEKDALIKNYAECMKDYAKEIFKEIDNLKKQYIKGDIDEHKFIVRLFLLKKKYTEGKDDRL